MFRPGHRMIWRLSARFVAHVFVYVAELAVRCLVNTQGADTVFGVMNEKCPRDGAALVERNDGRASFLHCETCGGIQVAFDELLEVGPTPPRPLDRISLESLPIDDTATCSCFGEPLMKTLQRDGVSIDVCPECDVVWLDRGELERIRAVSKGERPLVSQQTADVLQDLLDLEYYTGAVSSLAVWLVESASSALSEW